MNPLQWRHNGRNGVSNYQPHHCLLNRLFRHRSKKTSKLHVIDLCVGNSLVTGEFPAQMASNVENDDVIMHRMFCLMYVRDDFVMGTMLSWDNLTPKPINSRSPPAPPLHKGPPHWFIFAQPSNVLSPFKAVQRLAICHFRRFTIH